VVIALIAAMAGLAIMVAATIGQRKEHGLTIEDILGTPYLPEPATDKELSAVTGAAVQLAGQVVDRVDRDRTLGQALDRAKIPLRPGEYVIIAAGFALAAAALTMALTHSVPVAAGTAVAGGLLAVRFVKRRIVKQRRAFSAQLPDALSLVASSLSAGHTFLRAIQIMCEESRPPLSEEFARVVAETRLGDPLVDTLQRMAQRLQIRDMDMVVQAVRIQQTVGGRLADLLNTLGDFIRARDEVRREVQVLTAEGRVSAYVLAGLVPFLFGVLNLLNPEYIAQLYHGWGLYLLAFCATSVLTGLMVILHMVKIEI